MKTKLWEDFASAVSKIQPPEGVKVEAPTPPPPEEGPGVEYKVKATKFPKAIQDWVNKAFGWAGDRAKVSTYSLYYDKRPKHDVGEGTQAVFRITGNTALLLDSDTSMHDHEGFPIQAPKKTELQVPEDGMFVHVYRYYPKTYVDIYSRVPVEPYVADIKKLDWHTLPDDEVMAMFGVAQGNIPQRKLVKAKMPDALKELARKGWVTKGFIPTPAGELGIGRGKYGRADDDFVEKAGKLLKAKWPSTFQYIR